MNDPTVYAQSYARALMESAAERNQLTRVREDMAALQEQWEGSEVLRAFAAHAPGGIPAEHAALVRDIWGKTFSPLSLVMLETAAEWRDLPLIPQIIKQFFAFADAAESRVHVLARFAVAPDEAGVAKLRQQAEETYGHNVEMTVSVDPSLLAGMVIRIGDKRIDASLAGRVARLKRGLLVAEA